MKVGGAGRTQGPSGTPRTNKARGASGSGATFRLDGLDAAQTAREASGAASVAPVDALIALQEVPDATESRRQAIARAETMLDILDDVKVALLEGRLPRERLSQLLRLVEQRRDSQASFQDPRLQHVLDEIELRARVELAKYEDALAR